MKNIAAFLAGVVVVLSITAIAHAATSVPSVGKQLYKDNVAAVKALGGKAYLSPNIDCITTKVPTIYACQWHGTTVTGSKLCVNVYVAYRPGYHTLPWYATWFCGSKAVPLPPKPPLSRFRKIRATANTPRA